MRTPFGPDTCASMSTSQAQLDISRLARWHAHCTHFIRNDQEHTTTPHCDIFRLQWEQTALSCSKSPVIKGLSERSVISTRVFCPRHPAWSRGAAVSAVVAQLTSLIRGRPQNRSRCQTYP